MRYVDKACIALAVLWGLWCAFLLGVCTIKQDSAIAWIALIVSAAALMTVFMIWAESAKD